MKKPETLGDKMWRYRGVLLVSLVPVLLILCVLALVPRRSPLPYDRPLGVKHVQDHDAGFKYAVVFDAGSTGSRVHIFKFKEASNGLELVHDTFQQLKPGLSAYADDPSKAAESLVPLLDTVVRTVPEVLQASTPLSLKATAGLRLLPGDKADKILAAVTTLMHRYKFKMAANAVSIMDGQDEGAFAWLTLNYLLERLGKGPSATVSAIDLGGGSVQEAFAMTDEEAKAAPKGYTVKLKGAGTTYTVYVHSYLGYGLMAGRSKVMEQVNATQGSHPCFTKGGDTVYKYAGKEFAIKANKSHGQRCMNISTQALGVAAACGAAVEQCTFSGAWRGKARYGAAYYVSSYFWDRAVDSGIITDSSALTWPTTPEMYATKAAESCSKTDLTDLLATHKGLAPDTAPFLCLDLSYCHQLLTAGFKLAGNQPITLVKQISYKGQNIEASWALGAAVNDLSAT
ncbi:nucleoside phosphatase GDA1/CD39 [Haematococcus lacustris]